MIRGPPAAPVGPHRRTHTDRRANTARTPPDNPAATAALLVADELESVETRLGEVLSSREPRMTEIADHLISAGGKRVRPMVTLLGFRACGGSVAIDAVDVAVALELIHSASLLHDDIIDENDTRRGRASARSKYGIAHTLVAGDFLFSRAFQICGRFDAEQINWAAEACIALTEGEIMQSRFRNNPEVTLDDYLEIVYRKTASLFEQGARISAALARPQDPSWVDAIANCARHVGLTFQIVDDVLDMTADESDLGKPVGLDIREGNPSLPIVLAIAEDRELADLFAAESLSDGEVGAVLARIRRSGVIEDCQRLAIEHARAAQQALAPLPDTAYRDSLCALIEQLITRVA